MLINSAHKKADALHRLFIRGINRS